ncbi:MAPEG family protein [Sphingorhabdus sp.]|uniref:MAPEG family protein n=1 Tax=Sphingorhabdus sp. TaxID=1902408 RepID=UPI0035932446
MTLPVTAFVAAICAIMLLITGVDTVRHRMRSKVPFGDNNDPLIISASRSHGNLAEHAPIVILLMAFLEMSRAEHIALLAIGALFLAGRIAHIIGLYAKVEPGKPPLPRSIGVIVTWLTLAVLSGWTLWMLALRN